MAHTERATIAHGRACCAPQAPTTDGRRLRGVRVRREPRQPLQYSAFRQRVWQPACAKVGLPELGFHDLRRHNATTMVRNGVDVKTAQARLGHSDPRLTLGIYAQATTDADRAAADLLGDLLNVSDEPSRDERGTESA